MLRSCVRSRSAPTAPREMIKIESRVRCRLTGATGDVVAINEPEIIDRLGPFGIDKVPRVYVVDIV